MSEEMGVVPVAPAAGKVRPRTADGRFVGAGGARPAARRRKKAKAARGRWTPRAEAVFLEALAEHGNVAKAARTAKISDSSVYRQRSRSDDFRAKWAAALREGFAKLEALMLERALAGVEKPVWHGGKQVGTVHEFDNRLCLALLRAHRDTVQGVAAPAGSISEEEMRAAIADRLRAMNLNMGGAG